MKRKTIVITSMLTVSLGFIGIAIANGMPNSVSNFHGHMGGMMGGMMSENYEHMESHLELFQAFENTLTEDQKTQWDQLHSSCH